MATSTQTSRSIQILAGATVQADWMDQIECRVHADITVEAIWDRSRHRWVYTLNGRQYSCDSSSETFRWV